MKLRILELFSGIGGMRYALRDCLQHFENIEEESVIAAEIHPGANTVYEHNFESVRSRNVCGLRADRLSNINTILMSPPCQPFTRQGLQKDLNDPRTLPFQHVLTQLIPNLKELQFILLENVKGFETSLARDELIQTCLNSGFTSYREFLLCPTQFGIPNSRLRYYFLAVKNDGHQFRFGSQDTIITDITDLAFDTYVEKRIQDFLDFKDDDDDDEDNNNNSYRLNEKTLRRYAEILDIVTPDSIRSCCFTKSYGRYAEGTGSVITRCTRDHIKDAYKRLKYEELKLRYFTPNEIARLMGFPNDFSFPDSVTTLNRYRVLGNSLNVTVVSFLLRLLFQTLQN